MARQGRKRHNMPGAVKRGSTGAPPLLPGLPGAPGLPVWCRSLGCPKNRVDTERLLGSLGQPARTVENLAQSRLALINTCAFIEPATRESVRAILDAAEEIGRLKKRRGRAPLLAVAGCLVGRYGREVMDGLPEVDLWLPTEEMEAWPELVRSALGMKGGETPAQGRMLSTRGHAWLKIAEGCDNACSFCAIPAIRGRLRSAGPLDLAAEARGLLRAGARELCLVAQDITAWGRDLPGRPGLADLLPDIAALPGLEWLRLLYLYPAGIDGRLLDVMRGLAPKLLPYLDLPLQHSHPQILASMGRPFSRDPREALESARLALPGCALRATLIVGYPGETDAMFEDLLAFVRDARLNHLGVFTYFPEDGTRAAALPGQLPEDVKEERRRAVMELQREISRELLAERVGERHMALVDSPNPEWPGLYNARLWFQAPEVDGMTYLSAERELVPGELVECEIVDSGDYDLSALA